MRQAHDMGADSVVALQLWTTEQRAAGSPSTSIRLRRHHIDSLRRHLSTRGKSLLTADRTDLLAWLSRDGWAPESRKSARTSVRHFYRWASSPAVGLLDVDPSASLPPVKIPPPKPRPVPEEVAMSAIHEARRADAALALTLAAVGGLRRAEIARVHSDDISGRTLRVHGKGRRERDVPLPPALAVRLQALGPGWIFPSPRGGHFTPDWIGRLMSRELPDPWSPHKLRHYAASTWRRLGLDLIAIRDLLGHSSTETTSRYTAEDSAEARRVVNLAARRLDRPYLRLIAGGE